MPFLFVMGLFHRANLPPTSLQVFYSQLTKLYPFWVQPQVRLDRIIFPNLILARQFIEDLPGTAWYSEKLELKTQECQEGCFQETIVKNTELKNLLLGHTELPTIHCGIDTAFQIGSLLEAFKSKKKDLQMELLISDSEEAFDTAKMFLQDKWNEFKIQKTPRCSAIIPNYEIEYSRSEHVTKKRTKKRNRKLTGELQTILRKIRPDLYPEIVGPDYYGSEVFKAFLQLHLLQKQNFQQVKALYPPSPLKFFDLQDEGQIELRFNTFIPLIVFDTWIKHLIQLSNHLEYEPVLIRASLIYDAWNSESFFKTAGKDRIVWSWNDLELAIVQQNLDIFPESKNVNLTKQATFYFELTPMIDPSDVRVEFISKAFEIVPEMK